ncbi:unnamed protein product [Clonostachys chloroleuca]|uniref:Alcohol acetyltransferase FCK4 n=1 Tax=Clonostachys chloroleuca TaxID=1926264 RepID=A0AA35MHZ3_9HYPO|nr:unnamed protein product [Clonostachys chloroleuca]
MAKKTKSDAGHPRVLRKLGHLESYLECQHSKDLYCGTSLNCRYSIPPGLPSGLDTLQARFDRAVARIVLDQPMLQVGVRTESRTRSVFLHVEKVDLANHLGLLEIPDEGFQNAQDVSIRENVDRKFKELETVPGWRVAICKPSLGDFVEVNFVFHHTITDGNGAKVFHELLLKHLISPTQPEELQGRIIHLRPENSQPFPPAMNLLCNFSLSGAFILKQVWQEKRPLPAAMRDTFLAHWAPLKPGPATTRRRTNAADAGTLQRLLKTCREHETTLTALMHAMCLVSLADRLGREEAPGFTGQSALDLRRFAPVTPDGVLTHELILNIVSVMPHYFDEKYVGKIRDRILGKDAMMEDTEEMIWGAAKIVRQELKDRLSCGLKNEMIGLLRYVSDWETEKKKRIKRPREYAWLLSNIGVLKGGHAEANAASSEPTNWQIEQGQFSLSSEVTGSAFGVSAVGVERGGLCIDVSWQAGIYDDSLGEGLADDIGKWLKELGR